MATKKKVQRANGSSKAAAAAERAWLSTLSESQSASVPPVELTVGYAERQAFKAEHKRRADLEVERLRWASRKHRHRRKLKVPAGFVLTSRPGLRLEWREQRRPLYPGTPSSWQSVLLELLTYSIAWRVQLANDGEAFGYRWSLEREAEGIWSDVHGARVGAPAWLSVAAIAWLIEHFSLRGGGGRAGKLTPPALLALLAEPVSLQARMLA